MDEVGTGIGRLILSLVIVVGLIYLIGFAARSYLRRFPGYWPGGSGAMKVLQTLPLGPGKALFLVSVGGHTFLLGSSNAGLSLLAKIDDHGDEPLRGKDE